LNPDYVPNLKLTQPVFKIGPHPSWSDPKKIASIDPFGHVVTSAYAKYLDKGFDIRPTIAVTKAHIDLPECREAVAAGRLVPDGKILLPGGQSICSKAAIEPVWYLPEVARRFGCTEAVLRQSIFRVSLILMYICRNCLFNTYAHRFHSIIFPDDQWNVSRTDHSSRYQDIFASHWRINYLHVG
jgi:hypothetical protein